MKKYILLILLALITNKLLAQQLQPGKNVLTVDGKEVWVYTPNNTNGHYYDPQKTYTIVFELHGMRQNKNKMVDTNIVNNKDYIAVYPEGSYVSLIRGNVWNVWPETNFVTGGANHVTFLTNVYNKIKQRMGSTFDPNKVFVYGFSNGGSMALKMLEETNLFKGAVIRAMTFREGHNIPTTASKVPILFIHGTTDDTVPYNGGVSNKYFYIAPNLKFMPIKTTVEKWATHNGNGNVPPMDVKYLEKAMSSSFTFPDSWFREYNHSGMSAPVYFYAAVGGSHTVYTSRWIKRTAIYFFRHPIKYGLRRYAN